MLLEHARPTGAFMAGVVLAIANPNVFLLLSGLSIIVAEASSHGEQAAGAVFLLCGVAIDFVIPVLVYALFGRRARTWLIEMKTWLIAHDRVTTLVILYGFGVIFAGRGLGNLL